MAVANGAAPTRLRLRSRSAARLPAPLLAQVIRLHETATRNDRDPHDASARMPPRSSARARHSSDCLHWAAPAPPRQVLSPAGAIKMRLRVAE